MTAYEIKPGDTVWHTEDGSEPDECGVSRDGLIYRKAGGAVLCFTDSAFIANLHPTLSAAYAAQRAELAKQIETLQLRWREALEKQIASEEAEARAKWEVE